MVGTTCFFMMSICSSWVSLSKSHAAEPEPAPDPAIATAEPEPAPEPMSEPAIAEPEPMAIAEPEPAIAEPEPAIIAEPVAAEPEPVAAVPLSYFEQPTSASARTRANPSCFMVADINTVRATSACFRPRTLCCRPYIVVVGRAAGQLDPRRALSLRLHQGGAREGEPAEERRCPRRCVRAGCRRARRGARGARRPDARGAADEPRRAVRARRAHPPRRARPRRPGVSRGLAPDGRPVPRVATRHRDHRPDAARDLAGPHARDGRGGGEADVEHRPDQRRGEEPSRRPREQPARPATPNIDALQAEPSARRRARHPRVDARGPVERLRRRGARRQPRDRHPGVDRRDPDGDRRGPQAQPDPDPALRALAHH